MVDLNDLRKNDYIFIGINRDDIQFWRGTVLQNINQYELFCKVTEEFQFTINEPKWFEGVKIRCYWNNNMVEYMTLFPAKTYDIRYADDEEIVLYKLKYDREYQSGVG